MYKVSIFIPVYNQEDLIIKALDSIPARDDIEVIVCDDCSTDNTYEVIKSYNRIPIKLLRNEVNSGEGYTRNACLDVCSGDYIFGLDSDDELLTDKWSEVVDKYLSGNYDIVQIGRVENNGSTHFGGYAFHTHFIKRSTYGSLRCPEIRISPDYYFIIDLEKQSLNKINSNIVAYKYNYPREGSLMWIKTHNE